MRTALRFPTAAAWLLGAALAALPARSAEEDSPPQVDYIHYAHGAWLSSVAFTGAKKGPPRSLAFQTYDGFVTPREMLTGASPDAQLILVYELPAPTTFHRLAVPEVAEVPSAYTTFFREVTVRGSETGAEGSFTLLASATLATHARRGMVTELDLVGQRPVRFLELTLRGGIQDLAESMGYQFSELIGNGVQEAVPPEGGFDGTWDTKLPDIDRSAGLLELRQDGAAVTGCYVSADLQGSVSGNILRAAGISRSGGTPSRYVLLLDGDGAIRGAASVNNGPFGLFGGPKAPEGSTTQCSEIPEPELGCGSTVYVQFEFDSAELRAESEPVLADLFEGLSAASEATIVIEGHTCSEGTEEYNQGLSERRAQAVVADLIRRGIPTERIRAAGRGEVQPIASNKDETGRSLNRRVEVVCTD